MKGFSEQIRNTISDIPCNEIFVASELKKKQLPEVTDAIFYKTLERMTKQNKLVHLTKGLYYRPTVEEGKVIPVGEDVIVDYYVECNKGMLVGEGIFVEKGISSAPEKRIELISNKLSEAKKHIGEIEIHRTEMKLEESTILTIQVLEMLQNYSKVKDLDKRRFISYLHDFANDYSDEVTEYVLRNRKYKKSTIAFLARILEWYGVFHSLNDYLSPLSEYKIPTIEELRLDIPEETLIRLKAYVEEIKRIYNRNLKQVILYGSYAKGNYGENSDIDIMVLVDMKEDEIGQYGDLLSGMTYEFNMEYDLDIKPVTQSNAVFSKWVGVYPFYKNVQNEGIKLYGAA